MLCVPLSCFYYQHAVLSFVMIFKQSILCFPLSCLYSYPCSAFPLSCFYYYPCSASLCKAFVTIHAVLSFSLWLTLQAVEEEERVLVFSLYIRVEWFSPFFDFWKPTNFCQSVFIFRSSIPENQQLWLCACPSQARQSFNFLNITGVQKIVIFSQFS